MMPCLKCDRTGWEVTRVPTKMYESGYFTAARVCRACLGKKYIPIGMDNQTAAAGDVAA
jgi:hypothetical protein